MDDKSRRIYRSVMEKWGAVEVSPMELYQDVFRLGEGYIQRTGEYRTGKEFKGNPLGYWKNEKDESGHYRVLTEDNFENELKELQKADFSLLGGVTYFGRRPLSSHADKLYALIFDLDEVTPTTLNNFFSGAFNAKVYPIPQYMVISRGGKGFHLYYVMEEPIPLFPHIRVQLKELKYALTRMMWNRNTSEQEKVEYQGIFQRFRVAGAVAAEESEFDTSIVFRINEHPTSPEELAQYAGSKFVYDEQQRFKESKMTLEEAKKAYPEWYERVIEKKDRSVKKWDIKGKVHGSDPYALYHWWLEKIREGKSVGHRYFCIMTLTIMAVRNDYPYEKLKKDCYNLIPEMNEVKLDEPFTEKDVESALECYDDRYCTFPNYDISKLTDIPIIPNKRNGRKQIQHIKIMTAIRDVIHPDGEWRNKNGRPKGSGTAEKTVRTWREAHLDGRKIDCHRDTGLSRPTIDRWWNV